MIGLIIHGSNFFNSFLPQGTPLALAPLLIVIELISYTSHAVSLSIRLFANMMAGHALLKILAGFVWTMTGVGGILYLSSIAPLMVIIALTVLEFGIAALQAYVFTVLTCIYLKDTLYLH
jgi:F-type H+-transporting ATPase subunit a